MKISLILAVDNEDISNVLKTLRNQTIKSFELLVVSNKEDEKIENLVNMYNKFYDIKYFVANKKMNINEMKNLMLTYASYNIISFLNAKTIYSINTIETCITLLDNKPKQILVLSNNDNDDYRKKLNKKNIFNFIKSDNYFINFEKNDIYFLPNNYKTNANDIQYVINLIRENFSVNLHSSAKIYSADYSNKIKNKEIRDLMKKEIISNGNILLTSLYIKNLFKGEK